MDISVNFNRETPRELSLNFHWNDVTVRSNSQEMLCPFTAQHTSLEQCFRHVFFRCPKHPFYINIIKGSAGHSTTKPDFHQYQNKDIFFYCWIVLQLDN